MASERRRPAGTPLATAPVRPLATAPVRGLATAPVRGLATVLALALLGAVSGCAADSSAPAPTTQAADCPEGVAVTSAAALTEALAAAAPGDTIVLGAGDYPGSFVATASGTASAPITLCGAADAVLDGGSTDSGYTLHLDGASFWVLDGFAVRGGQKGVMLDGASRNVLTGLTVSDTGDEAVHLRAGSSDNLVEGSTIARTGLREPRFGEGVYVGTAESNWCDISGCAPDASDRNRIVGNTISATGSESIDVKEGTSGGELSGNVLDGAGITEADSLIDVKGSGWTVSGNTGTAAPVDGAQVHVILDGWGAGNSFAGNVFAVGAAGFAVLLEGAARGAGNSVACDNVGTVDGAADPAAVSNAACTG